jgi:hypothetical protein
VPCVVDRGRPAELVEESVVVEDPTVDLVSKAAKRLRKQLLGLTTVGRLRPGEHCVIVLATGSLSLRKTNWIFSTRSPNRRHLLRPTSYRDFIIVVLVLIAIERGPESAYQITTSTLSAHASALLLLIQLELVSRTGFLAREHPRRLDGASVEVTYSLVGDVFQAAQ